MKIDLLSRTHVFHVLRFVHFFLPVEIYNAVDLDTMSYLCVFVNFAFSLSWRLWLGPGDKDRLAMAALFLGRHNRMALALWPGENTPCKHR